jgi:hypothetical protein
VYVAKMSGHTVIAGIDIDIDGLDTVFSFRVLEVKESSFLIRWNAGDSVGKEDHIPHGFFNALGHPIEVFEIPANKTLDPNQAFLYKRLTDDI